MKIMVLKRFVTNEAFKGPPVKAKYSGPCPVFEDGQEFYVDDSMPSGFCPYAWDPIFMVVVALGSNGNFSECMRNQELQ